MIFSTVAIGGTAAILMYAKNDPDFRDTLEKWIPGTDKTIRIAFQEEGSYFDFLYNFFGTAKKSYVPYNVFFEVKVIRFVFKLMINLQIFIFQYY